MSEPTTKYPPEVARIIRLEFERLASKIERQGGNVAYIAAWRRCAQMIRDAKPD